MSRRPMLLLPAVLAATALPVSSALAGEDDSESATLHATQGCVSGSHTNAAVSGQGIESVAYFVDGKRVKTVAQADATGRYALTMTCSHLRIGAHRARARVTFLSGSTKSLRFQITRASRGTPRFAG